MTDELENLKTMGYEKFVRLHLHSVNFSSD